MTRTALPYLWRAGLVVMLMVSAACASSADDTADQAEWTDNGGPTPTSAADPPGTTALSAPEQPAEPVATAPPAASPPPAVPAIAPIDAATAARMSASWRQGCPVPLGSLRLVAIQHWSFEGEVRSGELVVAAEHAEGTVKVFEALLADRFPIAQVRLVDEYGGDDDRSMAANNTSAFNCRRATGSTRWSEHAYGAAIDINPIQNPYVTGSGRVLPPEGAPYVERDPATPGVIVADGPVVTAFADIGWKWGGDWRQGKDYQHFSASGR